MPRELTTQNLSGFMVGQSGSIDLTQVIGNQSVPYRSSATSQPTYTVRLFNESSNGLAIVIVPSQQMFTLPAGGWVDCHPILGDTTIDYTVVYVLPNPQVSLLFATLYMPYEVVPSMPILGNSSVGISGSVNTNVTGTTLINTGAAPSASDIIEIANTSSGGDITTLDNQGNFKNGNADYPGAISFDNGKFTTDGSGNITVNSLTWGQATSNTLRETHAFTGTGSGTYNHGCFQAPFFVCPIVDVVSSSATQGYGSVTSSQVTITLGASLGFKALCFA